MRILPLGWGFEAEVACMARAAYLAAKKGLIITSLVSEMGRVVERFLT